MSINFGLLPPLVHVKGQKKKRKAERRPIIAGIALNALDGWLN